ncbi:hypothetical protein [Haloglycomyces albus]|uniref:hypothetical protein n=1 Tax=Haloglycomyces albus TaxID=526067 RepID=UPI00046D6BCC|nr:hypothetical protein [Haloglycomyces albus]
MDTEERSRIWESRDNTQQALALFQHTNYNLETAGAGGEPRPERWDEPLGALMSLVEQQAKFTDLMREQLDRWAKSNRPLTPEDRISMNETKKLLKRDHESLRRIAGNLRTVRSHLQVFGTDPEV